MCGITGILSPSAIKIETLKGMNNAIRHRGPDDEGFVLFDVDNFSVYGGHDTSQESWQSEVSYTPVKKITECEKIDAIFALGHRRLSILDLSSFGHQPMCDETGRYWVAYNGEIYNYLEIKDELKAKGYHFSTNTDTEVILAAFREWGIHCQHKFNGMWAFILYDVQDRVIFVSRDRYGIKPLYYWIGPCGTVYFASEIKQFTVSEGWQAIINGSRVYDYLYYSLTDHTVETLFKGVYRVLPGHYVHESANRLIHVAKTGTLKQNSWYQAEENTFSGSFTDAVDQFKTRFIDSVRLHLRSDVPIGSALSGGLDSSSIVSVINKVFSGNASDQIQKTFSSCSHDMRYDERNWMDLVVEATGVEAHFVYPNGGDIFSLTETIIWHQDEPYDSQSAFLGYHVFEEARKNGVLVLLNGQGADEYLSCYSELKLLRQRELLMKGRLYDLFNELTSIGEVTSLIRSILFQLIPGSLRLNIATKTFRHRKLNEMIDHSLLISQRQHPYDIHAYHKSKKQEISYYQLFRDPLQRYLRWEDRNSMAHSVEARVPFLDHRLVEFTAGLPLEFLDAPFSRKRVLVEAMKGILTEKVRTRADKKGFITPEKRWFMEDFKNEFLVYFDEHIDYSKGIIDSIKAREYLVAMQDGKVPFDLLYWRMLLLCVWMKRFNVVL